MSLTRGAYVDTDIGLNEFINSDFTITARFMPQWTRGMMQPIVSSDTNDATGNPPFLLGLDWYFTTPSAIQVYDNEINGITWGQPIVLRIGSKQVSFTPNPAIIKDRWYHVTLQRSGCSLRLLLDGKLQLTNDGDARVALDNCDDAIGPQGAKLRVGRGPDDYEPTYPMGSSGYKYHPQFYGFIDDIAIFDKAIGLVAISAQIDSKTLTGSEPDLLAGIPFESNTNGASLPAVLARPITFGTALPGLPTARREVVSATRDNGFDSHSLPLPEHLTIHKLPFSAGGVWKVVQGYGWPTSHNNVGVFCADLAKVGGTLNEDVIATAAGMVTSVSSGSPTTDNGLVMLETAPRETNRYLHLSYAPPVSVGQSLASGDVVAQVGAHPNGAHLHFCTLDVGWMGGAISHFTPFPIAYENYQVSNSVDGPWTHVERGVPEMGQWIRALESATSKTIKRTVVGLGRIGVKLAEHSCKDCFVDETVEASTSARLAIEDERVTLDSLRFSLSSVIGSTFSRDLGEEVLLSMWSSEISLAEPLALAFDENGIAVQKVAMQVVADASVSSDESGAADIKLQATVQGLLTARWDGAESFVLSLNVEGDVDLGVVNEELEGRLLNMSFNTEKILLTRKGNSRR